MIAPSNDNVTAAENLAVVSGVGTYSNVDGTLEPGEGASSPSLFASVWFVWTAPVALPPLQLFHVTTVDPATDFDTQLSVFRYTGSGAVTSVAQLRRCAGVVCGRHWQLPPRVGLQYVADGCRHVLWAALVAASVRGAVVWFGSCVVVEGWLC